MEELNQLKEENYRMQKGRLKRAMNSRFFLEAVFIEYAIIEDRLDAVLRYEGNEIISDRHVSINRKLNTICKLVKQKGGLLAKYFDDTFIESIRIWKSERNKVIHSMMQMELTGEVLCDLAKLGDELQYGLCLRAKNYKEAVKRKNKRNIILHENRLS